MDSLLKFAGRRVDRNGQSLYWRRAAVDGAPFRGLMPPAMPEQEYEAKKVKVQDFQHKWFDIAVEAEAREYSEVMNGVANGWYRLVHVERFWQNTTRHYVEWTEVFTQLRD